MVSIKEQEASLKEALVNAEETVSYVREAIENHCKKYSKKKGECQEVTESGKFNVEPYYRTIRKQPVFIGMSLPTQPSKSPTRSQARSSSLTTSAPSSTRSTRSRAPTSTTSNGRPSK